MRIRDQGSGIRDQGSGIRDQGSGVSQESGTRSQGSGVGQRRRLIPDNALGSDSSACKGWNSIAQGNAGNALGNIAPKYYPRRCPDVALIPDP